MKPPSASEGRPSRVIECTAIVILDSVTEAQTCHTCEMVHCVFLLHKGPHLRLRPYCSVQELPRETWLAVLSRANRVQHGLGREDQCNLGN